MSTSEDWFDVQHDADLHLNVLNCKVVTPNITHWYKDHCTENSKVPLPLNVVVIEGNKFADLATFDWSSLQDEDKAAKKDFKATETIVDPKLT